MLKANLYNLFSEKYCVIDICGMLFVRLRQNDLLNKKNCLFDLTTYDRIARERMIYHLINLISE